MKKINLYKAWAALYTLCVGFGFISDAAGFGKFLLVVLGLLFFLPPFYLAIQARKEESRKTLRALRLICILSLGLTLLFLVLNFLSVYFSAEAGLWLYVLLVMVSAPMACVQYWIVSLFLWACLLFVTIQKRCPCQR